MCRASRTCFKMERNTKARDGYIRVVKRDGSLEPFDFVKLHNCIRNGFQAAGESCGLPTETARGLAEAVQTYLEQTAGDRPVHSGQIAELIELVLTETGNTAVGMAIKEHHTIRGLHRKYIRVAERRPRDGRYVHRKWDKSRISRSLREEHGLERPAARMIAGRVEQLTFNCGLRVVTTGLVSEMTRSELLAWGLLPGALVVQRRRNAADPRRRVADG